MLMDSIKFNIFEIKSLLTFLNDYIDRDNLSTYKGSPRYLFLAYVKLQKAKEKWEESMSYTE